MIEFIWWRHLRTCLLACILSSYTASHPLRTVSHPLHTASLCLIPCHRLLAGGLHPQEPQRLRGPACQLASFPFTLLHSVLYPLAGRSLEGFIPKSAKDFDEFGRLVAGVHLLPHARSAHYKASPPVLLCTPFAACECAAVLLVGWRAGGGGHAQGAAREVALQGEGRGCCLECCHGAPGAAVKCVC